MYKEYKEMLDEVAIYIHHLEETILMYEEKLKDMELDDMLEVSKYPGKSKYYYNRLEEESESRNVTEDTVERDHLEGSDSFEDNLNKHTSYEEWAYSKTEGDDDDARREALKKASARAEIELKKLDSLE
tara:strand:+ start:1829 stop:2215 length:387 start_codon:yes stop_codon:yes gene_type:complete